MNKILLLFIAVFALSEGVAQQNSYFVSFKDKINTPYSITEPSLYLSQKAIERRSKQSIAIVEEDLPVDPAYVATVESTGAISVRYVSKWFNGVIIQANSLDAESLKALNFVNEVEYIAPGNVGGRLDWPSKFMVDEESASDTLLQFDLLDISVMRQEGYGGDGVIIAVMDGGFEGVDTLSAFKALYDENRLILEHNFITREIDVYQYSGHGTRVLSTMAANQNNPEFTGIAPNASYMLFVTENVDIEYRIEEYWWLVAAEKADSAGVDIITTSLGYNQFQDPLMDYTQDDLDGRTAVISKAAQLCADKGIFFVTSGGNTGDDLWQRVTFPADIIDGLAVGSLIQENIPSNFSPYGPSADGRIKPDVTAIGSAVYLVTSDGSIVTRSGTSYSAPQVAGLAAGVWQAFPDVTASELITAFRESSSMGANPDNRMGYGTPSYQALRNYLASIESDNWTSIYPNPVEDNYLHVKVNNPTTDQTLDYQLYNTLGQPIMNGAELVSWRENEYLLDVSTLPQGLYVLNLQSTNNYSKLKFLKL